MENKISLLKNKILELQTRKIEHNLKHFKVEISWFWREDKYPQMDTFQVVSFHNQEVYDFLMDIDNYIHRYNLIVTLLSDKISSKSIEIYNQEFKEYLQEIEDLCNSKEFSEDDWVKVQQYL